MKKHNYTKNQLLAMHADNHNIILAANKAHVICTLAVLIDIFEFAPDQVEEFLDRYNEFLQSYDAGQETYQALRTNINDYLGREAI